MAIPKCGVCHNQDSKYKCPICELRYCSIPCYKSHKSIHVNDNSTNGASSTEKQQESPKVRSNNQKLPAKIDFTNFEHDQDFRRLLTRFPNLKHQLQLAYGVTLEPGPDDAYSWNRQDWFKNASENGRGASRGGFQNRGQGRGRGRGRGGRFVPDPPSENGMHGPWSQEKGDKQGQEIIQKMRRSGDDELADGMDEFVQLCQLKFGQKK